MARNHRNRHKAKRYRHGGGLLYRLLCAAVVLVVLLVGSAVFFRVNQINVTGSSHYTSDEVIEASGIQQGENLFVLNKYDAAELILQKLPYVSSVTIRRSLPDTLNITVTESNTAAWVKLTDGIAVINTNGKVMEIGTEQTGLEIDGLTDPTAEAGMPLTVQEDEQARYDSLLLVLQAFETDSLLQNVQKADMTSAAAIVLTYRETITIRLPYGTDYEYDMRALEAALNYADSNEKTTIDLTYSDGVHIIPE